MRPRDVSVSVVDLGSSLLVNAVFHMPGSLKRDELNKVLEWHRKQLQKDISRTLEKVEINDE